MIGNLLLHFYSKLGAEVKQKKMYALVLIAIFVAFYCTNSSALLFNKHLLMFSISTINIIMTLYYAKVNHLFVTRIEANDINSYLYVILFIVLYCYKAETITFLVCVNTFFVVKAIKNFKFRFYKFELLKLATVYSFCLSKFRLGLEDLVFYLYYSISFAVIMHKSRRLQHFYRANYQINFIVMFCFGLVCLFDADFYLSDFVTVKNIMATSFVVVLGVILLHIYIHVLIRFSLKTILFAQSQFIIVIIAISCANTFILLFTLSMVAISFYIIDFDYKDKFYDPFNEVLVNNQTCSDFIKKILQPFKNKERIKNSLIVLDEEF